MIEIILKNNKQSETFELQHQDVTDGAPSFHSISELSNFYSLQDL